MHDKGPMIGSGCVYTTKSSQEESDGQESRQVSLKFQHQLLLNDDADLYESQSDED